MISSWDFLPLGCSGIFLRLSHSSEYDREVETPLTMAVHWVVLPHHETGQSPLIKSCYLLLGHIYEFCSKRPIYRLNCAPQDPQASARKPALVGEGTSSCLCRNLLHLAVPANTESLQAPYFCPTVKQQLALELNKRHHGMTVAVRLKKVFPHS